MKAVGRQLYLGRILIEERKVMARIARYRI